MKEDDLVDEESCEDLMPGLFETKRGRGRPQEIADDTLRHALMELQFVLEQNWGLIGWELSRVKTPADVRSAFNLITGFHFPILDQYRHDATQPATTTSLRNLRGELAKARKQSRKAYEKNDDARRNCERTFAAITDAKDGKTHKQIQVLRSELAREFKETSTAFEASKTHLAELISQLDEQEAEFAQSQLVAFIRSRRNSFTPLSLAKGMAGLPYISARVSSQRCSSLIGTPQPGLTYQVFQAIESIFAPPAPTITLGIERMEALALDGPRKKPPLHIAEMRENWHFIRCAIQTVYRRGPHPRGSLPYRIHAEYQRRFSVQSQTDVLRAQFGRL